MRSVYLCLLVSICSGMQLSCINENTRVSDELKAGVSKNDITPSIGYPVHKTPSKGVLDSLEVKTIVFSQNACNAALVIADLFYVSSDLSNIVRKLASEKTGIPISNICVAATHTHADPTCFYDVEAYVQKINSGKLSKEDEATYAGQLVKKMVQSVVKAQANLKPVNLKSGIVQIEGLSFNRRHLLKNGIVKMNGGFLNPDILKAVGPVDPDVGIILLNDKKNDKPFASVTTFAMQLATIGKTEKFSSGFPHFIEKELQKHFGEYYVSIFGEGPCADVNHWDITKPGPQVGYMQTTKLIGEKIASRFIQKLPDLKNDGADLAVCSKVIQVPLQKYSNMDLAWARSYKDTPGSSLIKARVNKILALEELGKKYGDTLPLEVQAFRLNNETAIVALPGQVFVELGLALKEASPFDKTLIITLANSHEECIPLRKAYTEGSYEIVYSLVESGGGEMLVTTTLTLLNELK